MQQIETGDMLLSQSARASFDAESAIQQSPNFYSSAQVNGVWNVLRS